MTEELKKIDLHNTKKEAIKIEKKSFKISLRKKRFLIIFLILFILFSVFGAFLPAKTIYGQVLNSLEEVEKTHHAFKNQEIDGTKLGIKDTKQSLEKTKISLQGFVLV